MDFWVFSLKILGWMVYSLGDSFGDLENRFLMEIIIAVFREYYI